MKLLNLLGVPSLISFTNLPRAEATEIRYIRTLRLTIKNLILKHG